MKRILCALALVSCPIPAAAQEAGQAGLTAGFPGSIGVIWHASDAIAVRPDFSFSHTSSDSGSVTNLKTSSWGVGFGVSGVFYVGKVRDNVRTYLSPRFGYARTNTDTDPSTVTVSSSSHTDNYQYGGSFGAQYFPTRRFSVYGEVGVQYSHATSKYSASTSISDVVARGTSKSSNVATRGGVGVVWYFK